MDDAVGTIEIGESSEFAMELHSDGRATFTLSCNRGNSTWQSETGADPSSGTFELSELATTRALCPPSAGDRFIRDAQYLRSFLLRDGKLYLNLMADGGSYAWDPDEAK